jgi:hypothetical protein
MSDNKDNKKVNANDKEDPNAAKTDEKDKAKKNFEKKEEELV